MKDSFKYQGATDPPELAAYLRALADGLERGEIVARENGQAFSLRPRGLLNLSLRLRRKEEKSRVRLDIAWDEDLSEAAPEDGGDTP